MWEPTPVTAPPGGKACCARSVSIPTKHTHKHTLRELIAADSHDCLVLRSVCFSVIPQLTVSRSVFTAVDVSVRTSAPAGADTLVFFAPEG